MKYILWLYFLSFSVFAQNKNDWGRVLQLESSRQYEKAQEVVNKILTNTSQTQYQEWTRAFIRKVVLERTIRGHEAAVNILENTSWADYAETKTIIQLFYANMLWEYYKVSIISVSQTSKNEILQRIHENFYSAYLGRSNLENVQVKDFPDLVRKDGYPNNIRSTMRDFLCYNWIEFLTYTKHWTTKQNKEIYKIDFDYILDFPENRNFSVEILTENNHPLKKAIHILDDLYFWNLQINNKESALESQLERFRILQNIFNKNYYKDKIIKAMWAVLTNYEDFRWWTVGIHEYVSLLQSQDCLIEAHDMAEKAYEKYPGSIGGKKCLNFYKNLESPTFTVESMGLDGLNKRSILVHHKNVKELYFRAYKLDFESFLTRPQRYPGSVYMEDLQNIVKKYEHVSAWKTELIDFYDYKTHRTYVTPQVFEKGFYMVAVSAREDFAFAKNIVCGTYILMSDIITVETHKPSKPHGWEVMVVNSHTGNTISEAEVFLYQYQYKTGSYVVETKKTNEKGIVFFEVTGKNHFVVVRYQEEICFDPNSLYHYESEDFLPEMGTLIFTDKSIYKPLQKAFCKIVTYMDSLEQNYHTLSDTDIDILLVNPHKKIVDSKKLKTNNMGTISCDFVIPDDGIFGDYEIRAEVLGKQSNFIIKVEDYHTPSFHVNLEKSEQLILNHKAEIQGKAIYALGNPVSSGEVFYRITRIPQYPYWYWWHYDTIPSQGQEEVCSNFTKINKDGSFAINFLPEEDALLPNKKSISYLFQVYVELTVSHGETQSTQQDYHIGFNTLKANISLEKNFIQINNNASVKIELTDLNNTPQQKKAYYQIWSLLQPEYTILPQDFLVETISLHNTKGDLLRPRWEREHLPEEYLFFFREENCIQEGILHHSVHGEAEITLPHLPAGIYRVRYETLDHFGNKYYSQKEFIVAGERLNVPLYLIPEKTHYLVGEKIRLYLGSGFTQQKMFLEIHQKGNIIAKYNISEPDHSKFFEIDVLENYRGGITIKLHGVHDYKHYSISHEIYIPWDNKKLQISFDTFRDMLRPGQKESWKIRIKSDKPVEALAYMYDKKLDVFQPHTYSSVKKLYPNDFRIQINRDNIFHRHFYNIYTKGFYNVPAYPYYSTDRFAVFESYPLAKNKQEFVTENEDLDPHAASKEEKQNTLPENKKNNNLRSNFLETAFWQPHLTTDENGIVQLEFVAPDNLTEWRFFIHAITQDLQYASQGISVYTKKQLAVKSYVPQLLDQGQETTVKAVISNATNQELQGKIAIQIIDTLTDKDISDVFIFSEKELSWQIESQQSISISWDIKAPVLTGNYLCRIVAIGSHFSDGEQYIISIPSNSY